MPDQRQIIPTRIKNVTPRFLSYPVGAELISAAIGDVPQLPMLGLCFRSHPGVFKAPTRPFEILTAEYQYHKASRFSSRDPWWERWHEPRWEISIYAVPSPMRHQIKTLLLGEGIARAREWLIKRAIVHGEEGARRRTILFDPGFDNLRFDDFSSVDSQTARGR